MSNTNDLDPQLIKCIGLLYESRKLKKGDPVPLQYILEEAIFQKTGVVKDYTDFFQSQLPSRESEQEVVPTSLYDDKANDSDNDLELDLFKDDLSCVICNKMDVGARNRLLECSDCHALYHQECHKPTVLDEDVMETWICSNCKGISSKKLKTTSDRDQGSSSSKVSSSSSKSDGHRHASSSSSSHKSTSDRYKSSSKTSSGSSKSSSVSSPSHSSRSDEKKSSSKSGKSSKYYASEKRKHE